MMAPDIPESLPPAAGAAAAAPPAEGVLLREALDLIEKLPIGVWLLDREIRVLYANPQAHVDSQRPPGSMVGRRLYEMFPALVGSDIARAHARVLAGGVPERFESFYPPFDAWYELRVYPMAAGLAVFTENITERKRRDERLAAALEGSSEGFFDWNVRTGEVVRSPVFARILGGDPASLEPHLDAWRARIHPDDLARVDAARDAHFRGETPAMELEYRVRHEDGGWRWVLVRGRVLERGPDGAPLRVAGTLTDLTERHLRDEAVQRGRDLLAAALDAGGMVVLEWLPVTGEVRWIAGPERATRLDAPRSFDAAVAAVHPDDRDELRAGLLALARGDLPVLSTRYRLADADHAPRWVELTARRDAAAGRVVGVARDITEEKRLEQQLLRSQKLESVGRLAGGIAHDFNNLLTAMHGEIDLARLDLPAGSPMLEVLDRLQAAASRAGTLTHQLLAFARRQFASPRVVRLDAIVREFEPLLRRVLRENVRLDIRPAADGWPVRLDPSQVEQVLMNLVVNASDAMPDGGTLTIETSNATLAEPGRREGVEIPAGDYVLLAVSDTGTGMDERTLARIFEPYFTTKEQGKGTGLGLAITYGIVKQNQGFIWVYSEPGAGTTFRLYFPRAGGAPPPALPPRPAGALGGSEVVLLAEDDPQVREMASRALRAQGYRLLAAADGASALEVARAEPGAIDLLVTDVIMPDMTGRALAQALAAERPGMRVLFVSGYTEAAVSHQGLLDPGVAFLAKPYTPSSLGAKLREVLGRAG